jgi:corrinoid protein of di/trimethylamine methyltransferase
VEAPPAQGRALGGSAEVSSLEVNRDWLQHSEPAIFASSQNYILPYNSPVLNFTEQGVPMSAELFQKMSQSIIDGDSDAAAALAKQAVESGVDPLEAISNGFVIGVNTVGEAFAKGEAFLPELVMAGEAMKAAIAVLEPEMQRRGTQRTMLGKVVLATVEGDIHEIGKSLVGTMLSASGFQVYDLGVDVPAAKIIAKVREVDADMVGLSALLTTTMVKQKEVIDELDKQGLRKKVKVLVGGAPVTRDWVHKIEADGYSEDAIGAVKVAKSLVGAA